MTVASAKGKYSSESEIVSILHINQTDGWGGGYVFIYNNVQSVSRCLRKAGYSHLGENISFIRGQKVNTYNTSQKPQRNRTVPVRLITAVPPSCQKENAPSLHATYRASSTRR